MTLSAKPDTIANTGIETPVIEGLTIPREFWGNMIWEPHYWTRLAFDVRQEINTKTICEALERLKGSYEYAGSYKYYSDWRGHSYALGRIFEAVKEYRHELLLEALRDREAALTKFKRVYCGARKKTGEQCKAMAEIGKNRCRFHGGKSTGPKTLEGKLRSLSALPQYRKNPMLLEAKRQALAREFGTAA